jgi:hypothetical protein
MKFCWELPAPGRGTHRSNGILPGISRSWMRNQPEEWNSARNYQFLDASTFIMRNPPKLIV